jgi:uncharacterized membrane protein YfcA
MSQEPPPIPPGQPSPQIPYRDPTTPSPTSGVEQYNRIAETVGMMPTLRVKDNIVQFVIVLIGTILGAVIGYFVSHQDPRGAALGALIGLCVVGIASGIVLMFIGWRRARPAVRGSPTKRRRMSSRTQ